MSLHIGNILPMVNRPPRVSNGLPEGVTSNGNWFKAQIREYGKRRCIGSYTTVEEAELAQLKARVTRDMKYIAQAQEGVDKMNCRKAELEALVCPLLNCI